MYALIDENIKTLLLLKKNPAIIVQSVDMIAHIIWDFPGSFKKLCASDYYLC